MDVEKLLKAINNGNFDNDLKKHWIDVFYGMNLHIAGACPAYTLATNEGFRNITPEGYLGSEYQSIFNDRLLTRHPREPEITRQWRFSQYKPLTKSPFNEAIELTIAAILQDNNYTIDFIDNKEDSEYFWSNNFDGYDYIGWYANIGFPNIAADPNGFVIRMPKYSYYEIKELGQNAKTKLEIELWYIHSDKIIFKGEKSLIFKKDGYIYYVDTLVIYRFKYDNKTHKYYLHEDDKEGYYAHSLGRLPYDVGGGVWNNAGYYESYYSKAKPKADEYISTYSAEQMVDKEASHPYIIMADEDCDTCHGAGLESVRILDCDGDDSNCYEKVKCRTCKGKGAISRNPADVLLAPVEDMDKDLIKIVNPNVDINRYHNTKNIELFKELKSILFLDKSDKAESGEAKAIDQENKYLFYSKVSNHLFDTHIYNGIKDLIEYRNIQVGNNGFKPKELPFKIIKPSQFNVKNAQDLLDEFESVKDSGLPVFIRRKKAQEYVDKQFNGDPVIIKQSQVFQFLDKTFCYTVEEKAKFQALGIFSKNDLLFSDNLPLYVDQIIMSKGVEYFLNIEISKLREELLKMFEQDKVNYVNINIDDELT